MSRRNLKVRANRLVAIHDNGYRLLISRSVPIPALKQIPRISHCSQLNLVAVRVVRQIGINDNVATCIHIHSQRVMVLSESCRYRLAVIHHHCRGIVVASQVSAPAAECPSWISHGCQLNLGSSRVGSALRIQIYMSSAINVNRQHVQVAESRRNRSISSYHDHQRILRAFHVSAPANKLPIRICHVSSQSNHVPVEIRSLNRSNNHVACAFNVNSQRVLSNLHIHRPFVSSGLTCV